MHIVIYAIYMHLYFRTIFAVFWEPRCLNTTRIWKMLDKTICLMCLKHSSKTTVPKESPHCKVAKIWGSSSYLCTWNLYLFSAFFFWKSEIASTRIIFVTILCVNFYALNSPVELHQKKGEKQYIIICIIFWREKAFTAG